MTRAAAISGTRRRFQRVALVRYLLALTALSMAWEFAQMPLYTLGQTGTLGEIVFGALHCTLGDAMIGALAIVGALLAFGDENWPESRWARVLGTATVFGLGYTVFSEWWNVEVRGSWAYTERMLVLPFVGTGLSPLLQWMVVPSASFVLAVATLRRARSARAHGTVGGMLLSPRNDGTAAGSGLAQVGRQESARSSVRPGALVDFSGEAH